MKLNQMQQNLYDVLIDTPPVTERNGVLYRDTGTPSAAAFWQGVDNYQQARKQYVRDSAIYGALLAGHGSQHRSCVKDAQ